MACLTYEIIKNSKTAFCHCRPLRWCQSIVPLVAFMLSMILHNSCNADAHQMLTPGKNHAVDLKIENNNPVHLQIDTSALDGQIHGNIPITFHSSDEQIVFSDKTDSDGDLHWHDRAVNVTTKDGVAQANSDQFINLTLNTTEDMVGKQVRVYLEKEENLSKVAVAGAFVPQILPIMAMNSVVWQPHNFWPTLLRWNYLLLELDLLKVIDNFLFDQVYAQSQTLMTKCSRDFVKGFITYSLLTNYGEDVAGDPFRPEAAEVSHKRLAKNEILSSKTETFRTYLRTTPPNAMLDCVSTVVADSLKSIHKEGRLPEIVGHWSMLDTLNDETLEGIASLMVGYGFNLFSNVPAAALSQLQKEAGLANSDGIASDFNDALKTSIQYTIHNGYMKFFTGRGWSNTTAYTLSAGAGLLEIGYRFQQLINLIPLGENERSAPLNRNLQHHLISIGERAEAIASTGYQLIPVPKTVQQYALPVAATLLPLFSYYALDGIINYYTTGAVNIAAQKALTSASNGLVLGALLYIILPRAQAYGSWVTQAAADQVVSWTEAQNDSWIGYFAARDTHYKIRVTILEQ